MLRDKNGNTFFFFLFFSFLLAFPCKQAGRLEKRYEESNFSHFSRYLFSQEFANRVSILRRKCLLETKAHRARIEAPYIFKQWIDVFEIARRPRSRIEANNTRARDPRELIRPLLIVSRTILSLFSFFFFFFRRTNNSSLRNQ